MLCFELVRLKNRISKEPCLADIACLEDTDCQYVQTALSYFCMVVCSIKIFITQSKGFVNMFLNNDVKSSFRFLSEGYLT